MTPTPEQVEAALTSQSPTERGLAEGVKAACERLAVAVRCDECGGYGNDDDCPVCEDSGQYYRTWQDACRSLGEQ